MAQTNSIYDIPYDKYDRFIGKELTAEDVAYLKQCLEMINNQGGRAAGACCLGIAGRFAKERRYIENILETNKSKKA